MVESESTWISSAILPQRRQHDDKVTDVGAVYMLLIFGYDATRESGVVSLRQSVDSGPPWR